jgi:hypothetical protein
MTATPDTHARDNATAWLATIREMVAALDAAYDVSERDGAQDAIDRAQTAIHEAPLSVEVRSGWYRPCDANPEPLEYRILLTWGGPAAQITGQLDAYGQPDTARLEYQDWGTPWTARPLTAEEREDVLTFAQAFYYGD